MGKSTVESKQLQKLSNCHFIAHFQIKMLNFISLAMPFLSCNRFLLVVQGKFVYNCYKAYGQLLLFIKIVFLPQLLRWSDLLKLVSIISTPTVKVTFSAGVHYVFCHSLIIVALFWSSYICFSNV